MSLRHVILKMRSVPSALSTEILSPAVQRLCSHHVEKGPLLLAFEKQEDRRLESLLILFKFISKKGVKVEFESRFVFCSMRVKLSVLNPCLLIRGLPHNTDLPVPTSLLDAQTERGLWCLHEEGPQRQGLNHSWRCKEHGATQEHRDGLVAIPFRRNRLELCVGRPRF